LNIIILKKQMSNGRVKSLHIELACTPSGFMRLGMWRRRLRIFLSPKLFPEHSFSGDQLMLTNCKSKRNLNNLHATLASRLIYSEYT
jgi:hypothetical protein